MERNVLCVKWGDKYSAEDVNRLYRMVQKNTTVPFSFYCLTEDPAGVDCETIPIDESLGLEKWWWKICLFKDNLVEGDVNLFFDLDVVIQNNIDDLFNVDCLTLIDYSHKNVISPLYINSSIMGWKNNTTNWIYEKFMSARDLYLKVYTGLDSFMYVNVDGYKGWDDDVYYSRTRGVYDTEVMPNDGKVKHDWPTMNTKGASCGVYYFPEKKVCIFNQTHMDKFYKGFEKYYN